MQVKLSRAPAAGCQITQREQDAEVTLAAHHPDRKPRVLQVRADLQREINIRFFIILYFFLVLSCTNHLEDL